LHFAAMLSAMAALVHSTLMPARRSPAALLI
jgi:hypothetical protein